MQRYGEIEKPRSNCRSTFTPNRNRLFRFLLEKTLPERVSAVRPTSSNRFSALDRVRFFGFLTLATGRMVAENVNSENSTVATTINGHSSQRIQTVKLLALLLITFSLLTATQAQEVKRNIAYSMPANERQMLDVYSP